MSADRISPELYRPLVQLARQVPSSKDGKPIRHATLRNWIIRGVALRGGGRIRLRATRFPSGWRSTDAWFAEFLQAIDAAATGERLSAGHCPSSPQKAENMRRAKARLQKTGA
jgi:hypothetical protein